MRSTARILSTVLITAGLVVLVDVGLTLAWKEPASSLYGWLQQREARGELDDLEASTPSPADLRALRGVPIGPQRARVLADRFEQRVRTGHAIGRLQADRLDLSVVVLEGTDTATLQKGPGRYPDTSLPGQGKTVGIAGHRTTYLAPFRNVDRFKRGDDVVVRMPYANFTYRVEGHRIVAPSEIGVIRNVGYERLVLTACHPLYSAAQRYTIFAKLKKIELPPEARRP